MFLACLAIGPKDDDDRIPFDSHREHTEPQARLSFTVTGAIGAGCAAVRKLQIRKQNEPSTAQVIGDTSSSLMFLRFR